MPKRPRVPLHPLRLWMLEHGVTQSELAPTVGVDQAYLSQVINGRRRPSRELAKRISEATGKAVSIQRILDYELPKGAEAAKKKPRGRTARRGAPSGEGPIELPEDPEKVH